MDVCVSVLQPTVSLVSVVYVCFIGHDIRMHAMVMIVIVEVDKAVLGDCSATSHQNPFLQSRLVTIVYRMRK